MEIWWAKFVDNRNIAAAATEILVLRYSVLPYLEVLNEF